MEAIPALVWRAGPEGNIEYVNKRVLEYLGAPPGEVIGWRWMDKVHPDNVAFKEGPGSKISNPGILTMQSADFEERTVDIGGSREARSSNSPHERRRFPRLQDPATL